MTKAAVKKFSEKEHDTWRKLYARQAGQREQQIYPIFSSGIRALDIGPDRIPDLEDVNRRLKALTGFSGVPVEGLEGPQSFYGMLARREFPIGNFIRDPRDLAYTPAPDIFHDLYGHIPFFADGSYADFCQRFGEATFRTIQIRIGCDNSSAFFGSPLNSVWSKRLRVDGSSALGSHPPSAKLSTH